MQRKLFLTGSGFLLAGWPLAASVPHFPENLFENLPMHPAPTHANGYKDEEYWSMIRSFFVQPTGFINLENGYFSPQPLSTLQQHQRREYDINRRTSFFMRREQEQALKSSHEALASFLGCSTEELAITRNTTEALNILISGYPWQKGDEVVIGNQDYGSMEAAFLQQQKRYGILVRMAEVPMHPQSDDEVVDAYISRITKNTRLLHLTHLINLTGQVLPVKKIIDAAHARGVEVAVDAAHSVAHIDVKMQSFDADYVGASLHKWMCCPLGAGFLLMKKKHISKIWPLMGDNDYPADDIRKFEHQGTRPIQTLLTISDAIRFHESIGGALKEQRLKYLKSYWTSKVDSLHGVTLNTPAQESRSSAIANFQIKGMTPDELAAKLYNDFKIFTVAINHPVVKGVRVTPHIFTTTTELDALVEAIKSISGN